MKEAPIITSLTLPSGESILAPSKDDIRRSLENRVQSYRTVGDTWLRCRPSDFWLDGQVNRNAVKRCSEIIFYLGRDDGAVLIYSDGSLNQYYAYVFDPNKDTHFEAEDDGESAWLLNERYLTPIDKATDLAYKLVKEHKLGITEDWEPLEPEY